MASKDFNNEYASLNSQQKEAVDHIDGPVMVLAGPGTGKTQLIALRAANILQKTDVLPQNICCLTYTEVGARNMRKRLSTLIGQQAYDIKISTYHGFGSELIKQHKEYFTDIKDDKPLDSMGQIKLLKQVYESIPTSNPLWRDEVYLKSVREFIGEAKKALLSPEDISLIAKKNLDFVKKASVLSKKIPVFKRMGKDQVPHFQQLLEDLVNLPEETINVNSVYPLRNLMIFDLTSALEEYQIINKTNPITKFKDKWLQKNDNNQLVLQGKVENNKIIGAAEIFSQYQKELSRAGYFDYDDMINRAISALQENPSFKLDIQERYQYLMLDEFQDTNRSQLKLVELLTDNPSNDGHPNVLAVGDDDQAIFSFQGAELGNMIEFTRLYKDIKLINLEDNYRSHKDILSTAYNVANTIEERLSHKLQLPEKKLKASNVNIQNSQLERWQFSSDARQFEWVAEKIDYLVNQKGLQPSEIAVIAPKHKHLEPLVPYLQKFNLPIKYEKRENILEDPRIVELLVAAQLVSALSKKNFALADSLWPAVLSANYFNIPTSKIWELSWKAKDEPSTNDENIWIKMILSDQTLKPIGSFFLKLSIIEPNEPLEKILDYLTGTTELAINEPDVNDYKLPYFDYYFSPEKKSQDANSYLTLLNNLTILREKIREYHKHKDKILLLDDLLELLADYQNANEKMLNTSPYQSSANSVELLTAFSAKGLEFEAVFILAVHDGVWGMKDRSVNNIISLPVNLKIIRRAGATKDEKKRIFFVALSRAKSKLFLLGYSQSYSGAVNEPLEFLDETDQKTGILPVSSAQIKTDPSETETIERLETTWKRRHSEAIYNQELLELARPRVENFQLSATHLNSFLDLTRGGPENFFINTILRFPKSPSADGQFGNAIHETLEKIQYHLKQNSEMPEIEEINSIFKRQLRLKILSESDYKKFLKRGEEALEKFMEHWWHNFTPNALVEKSFLEEASFVGSAHLNGNLDQVLVDEETKTIRVVDFKTGKPESKWQKKPKSYFYNNQLLFYKILVEASHSYKNFEVNEAKLVFVEPDAFTNKFSELNLDINNADINKFKTLIESVYNKIVNLDFPKTDDFSKDYKGIISFSDWLINN
jgi:DNA helicase-2/ATP-dependent DNA helicase PcrA